MFSRKVKSFFQSELKNLQKESMEAREFHLRIENEINHAKKIQSEKISKFSLIRNK